LVSTLLLCEHTSSKFWMADLVKTDATKTTTDKDKKLSKTKRDIQRDRKTERHINRKRNRSKTSRNILYEVK